MKWLIAALAIACAWLAGSNWILFILILITFAAALYRWDRVQTQKRRREQMKRDIGTTQARSHP